MRFDLGLRGARVRFAGVAVSLLLAACTQTQPVAPSAGDPAPPTPFRLAAPVTFEDDWSLDGLAEAALASERYYARKATAGPAFFELGADRFSLQSLRASNLYVLGLLQSGASPAETMQRLRQECRVYRATGRARFTAYYEPVFDARAAADGQFRWPLYALPADASQLDRADIDGKGALDGRGLELFWLNDPVDRFFLQVQGSARLRLADGSMVRVGYAGSNGRPYVSIGRIMLDEGRVPPDQASAEGLANWLRENPAQRDEILFQNPRYIFFKTLNVAADEGPQGAFGQSLVAGRSVAADSDYVPPGVLLYMETHAPQLDQEGNFEGLRPLRRFALSHDRGSAIKGPGRIDIFWGTGARAGAEAGFFSEAGRLWVLLCGPTAGPTPKVTPARAAEPAATRPTSRRRLGASRQ